MDFVTYLPTGFFLSNTAYRSNVSGVVKAPFPVFWGVQKTYLGGAVPVPVPDAVRVASPHQPPAHRCPGSAAPAPGHSRAAPAGTRRCASSRFRIPVPPLL